MRLADLTLGPLIGLIVNVLLWGFLYGLIPKATQYG